MQHLKPSSWHKRQSNSLQKEKTAAHPGKDGGGSKLDHMSGPMVLNEGRQNPAIRTGTVGFVNARWDRQFTWTEHVTRAGQTIAGNDRPTNNITHKAATPRASEMIVSLLRISADLISLAILALLVAGLFCCSFVLIRRPLCKELYENISKNSAGKNLTH